MLVVILISGVVWAIRCVYVASQNYSVWHFDFIFPLQLLTFACDLGLLVVQY